MKEYIEKILHQDVQVIPYEKMENLPLAYKSDYELQKMIIGGQGALFAAPKEKLPLVTLRKQQSQMMLYTGLPCVLYLKDMTYYARDALIKEGIPFVWEDHQIYLPFIGTLLDDHKRTAIPMCTRISYLTQKLLLTALYQRWRQVTVTEAASSLTVSKMSITRCFDELEAFNLPYLKVRSRARSFTADPDKKVMWENIRGILRNPIISSYALKEAPDKQLPLAGETALAHYSMLDEGPCPVFSVTKKDLPDIDLSRDKLVPAGEAPGCIIQKMGYQISFEDGVAVDPLTVALSISEEEKADPRISLAIDEMLEGHVW